MTNKSSKANRPQIHDLEVLHLYARSLPESGRLSGRKFEKQNSFSDGYLRRSTARLEAVFGTYIIVKMVEHGDGNDINHAEELPSDRNVDELKISNRDRLTLAGQIAAEIASIFVGHTALAKLAIGKQGRRSTDHAMRSLLARLRSERRRLHDLVIIARQPGADFESLAERLDHAAFEYDPRDGQNMITEPLPWDAPDLDEKSSNTTKVSSPPKKMFGKRFHGARTR